jgi:hypothetical protein
MLELLLGALVLLQVAPPAPTGTAIPTTGAVQFFSAILNWLKAIAGGGAAVSFGFSGFELMFNRTPRGREQAIEALKWAVIGLIVVLAADQLKDLIQSAAQVGGG